MKKRLLGATGLNVSEIAFGGVGIGMPYAGKPMPDEKDSIRLLHRSLDAGINYYDTARMYGASERIMGQAFRDRRDRVLINTKCVHFLNEDGKIPDGLPVRKTICDSLDESLKTLRTDYVDVFMLHQSSPDLLKNEEVAEVFVELRNQGKVRAIGASTYTPEESKWCIDSEIWDVIQVPFNLMDQRQRDLFPVARERGIGLVIRSVLFRGFLTGQQIDWHPALADVAQHLQRFSALTDGIKADLLALAIKYVLSYAEVGSVLIGMDQMDHLVQALEVADGKYYDPDFRARLEAMAYPDPAFLNFSHWVKNGWLEN